MLSWLVHNCCIYFKLSALLRAPIKWLQCVLYSYFLLKCFTHLKPGPQNWQYYILLCTISYFPIYCALIYNTLWTVFSSLLGGKGWKVNNCCHKGKLLRDILKVNFDGSFSVKTSTFPFYFNWLSFFCLLKSVYLRTSPTNKTD